MSNALTEGKFIHGLRVLSSHFSDTLRRQRRPTSLSSILWGCSLALVQMSIRKQIELDGKYLSGY